MREINYPFRNTFTHIVGRVRGMRRNCVRLHIQNTRRTKKKNSHLELTHSPSMFSQTPPHSRPSQVAYRIYIV